MGTEKQKITIQIIKNFKNVKADLPRLKKLVKAICNRFRLSNAAVNILIVGNTQIRNLNKQFLKRNCTTDCLSFEMSDDNSAVRTFDVVVNAEIAAKEAKRRGHRSEAELALYITHGLLHNLGFDDSSPKKAKKMHDAEDEILRQFGYKPVYKPNRNGV